MTSDLKEYEAMRRKRDHFSLLEMILIFTGIFFAGWIAGNALCQLFVWVIK